ncbi:UNVERIFIED_CONTAM: hypothetical protein FKN15_072341 [Acipenser sinensis]
MSFESYLSYDVPQVKRKKKNPSRPPPAPHNPPKTNRTQPTKRASQEPPKNQREKSRKIQISDIIPVLPDIPLPAIQPNYRPLPSLDPTPLSPQRRKVPLASPEEDDQGFTGRRLNSKMAVYSGSKTSYLPKMMSLYEQCIRVLQNNIDSIDEVGGVPYEILEPVLERCTPEQLYRIEQCNQVSTARLSLPSA